MAKVAPEEAVPARTINVAAADDEGEEIPFNFEAHGKKVRFSENALFILKPDSGLRKAVVDIILNPRFDNFILFCILINTILMAMQDFRYVYETDSADGQVGEITKEGFGNTANDVMEIPFTLIFFMEFLFKVVGMGFYDPAGGAYLSEYWNCLDFLVVVTSIAPWVPFIPNVSAIRTFRVLRPLKSLNAVPKLKVIVVGMLEAVSGICDVGVVLLFVFTIFGIMGVQLFGTSGAMHQQCRATPFPVTTDWTPGDDFYEFACLTEAVTGHDPLYTTVDCRPGECDIPAHVGELKESPWIEKEALSSKYASKSSSPWSTAQSDCFWPLSDRGDEGRMCSFQASGFNCYADVPQYTQEMEAEETIDWWAYRFGNARGGERRGKHGWLSGRAVANRDDDEAWMAINRTWCGSNFDAFGNSRFAEGIASISDPDLWTGDFNWGFTTFDNLAAAWLTIFQSVTMEGWSDVMYMTMDATDSVGAMIYFVALTCVGAFWSMNLFIAVIEGAFPDKEPEDEPDPDGTAAAGVLPGEEKKKKVVHPYTDWITEENGLLSNIVIVLILVNTLVLSLDHHGMPEKMELELEIVGNILALCFLIEMLLKIGALGMKTYCADNFNKFDGFIVLTSIFEFFGPKGSSLSIFRMLRLLRIFKLAKKWTEMQNLLVLMYETFIDVGAFFILVIMFMFIFALLGMQMFANRMRFHPEYEWRLNIMPEQEALNLTGYYWNSTEIRLGESRPRHHFDTFGFAFTTVFGILSGENWNGVMYDGWRAMGPRSGGGDKFAWASTAYFILLIIVGAFVVLNLCVVLLLNNLQEGMEGGEESDDEEEEEEEEEQWNEIKASAAEDEEPKVKPLKTMAPDEEAPLTMCGMATAFVVGWFTPGGLTKKFNYLCLNLHPELLAENAKLKDLAFANRQKDDDRESLFPLTKGKAMGLFTENSSVRIAAALLAENPAFDNTVLVLIMISTVLLTLQSPLQNPHSDLVSFMDTMDVILTILFNFEMLVKIAASGFLCLKGSYLRNPWNQLDFVVVVISNINVLVPDCDVAASGIPMSAFKVIRTLRAFRPLRMIQRAPGLKVLVNAIFSSIPGVANVSLVLLIMLLMFAILSVQNYKGLMRSCQGDHYDYISENEMLHDLLLHPRKWNDLNMTEKAFFGPDSEYFNTEPTESHLLGVEGRYEKNPAASRPAYTQWQDLPNTTAWYDDPEPLCGIWKNYDSWSKKQPLLLNEQTKNWWNEKPTGKVICRCLGAQWDKDVPQSFDNVFEAMTALFELSTTEGWLDVLYVITDNRGVDEQPMRVDDDQVNWMHTIYFILVIVLWNFLFLNLFVGITIDNFDRIKAKSETGSIFLTDSQKEWVRTQEMLLKINPQAKLSRPADALSAACFDLVNHKFFDPFIIGCIILNTASLAADHMGQSEEQESIMETINMVLAIIFTVEMVAKLAALRWEYYADGWNCFDFFVVILTWISMVGGSGGAGSVLRSFRVLRVVRLMNRNPQLKQIFNTLFITLPALSNLAALLVLLLVIFSVMAVQLFATVQLNGGGFTETINFQTFFRSFISLLRFSTGENWNGFMHEVAFDYPGCRKPGPACLGPDFMNYDSSPNVCGYHDVQGCTPIDGCGEPLIYPYMIVFNMIIAFVFLNLFIGVILEGFDNADEAASSMNEDDFEWFNTVWNRPEFDPPSGPRKGEEVCFIDVDMLQPFAKALVCDDTDHPHSFQALKAEWGLDGRKGAERKLEKFLHKFDLKIFANEEGNHTVHFKHVLMVFGKELLRIKLKMDGKATEFDIPAGKEEKVADILKSNVGQYMRGIDTHALLQSNDTTYTLKHHSAAMVLSKRLKENQLARIRARAKEAREKAARGETAESPKKGAAAFSPVMGPPATPKGGLPPLDGDSIMALQATPKNLKNQQVTPKCKEEAKEEGFLGPLQDQDHEDSLL
eukprot:CAMPEP_0119537720 /NCGR_PEP_ID=MMETSP1344-20130328/50317_1 /TAXON_ID=236787 /ORGANISM="Florenciella parvula, Strain CCMP2471" /LENGTH=1925 /DNA_ID=CAMNT_0007580327 /DNA_START=292 /DNA_END=6069 /DNA_ORIENTATION=+